MTAGNAGQVTNTGGGTYDLATTTQQSTYVPGTYTAPQTTFVPRRATCPAINLSSKGAGVGVQTMETNLLKSVFNDGDTGPPTPTGIRMHGIFARFHRLQRAVLPGVGDPRLRPRLSPRLSLYRGCQGQAARSLRWTRQTIRSRSPSVPTARSMPAPALTRCMAASSPARTTTTTSPLRRMEQTCNLAVLAPSKEIPVERWYCGNHDGFRVRSANARRRPLYSGRAARQRHALHRFRTRASTRRAESPRRAPLHSVAR